MKEKTVRYIKKVQEEMELFSQALKGYAVQEFERIASMGEEDANAVEGETMSDDMIQLMTDNETLNAHLEASKENIDSKVSDQETKIVRELMNDWRNTEQRILDSQHHRNRTIVQEIIKTCEKFKKEISKKHTHYRHICLIAAVVL